MEPRTHLRSLFWLIVVLLHAWLCLYTTAEDGLAHDEREQQPRYDTPREKRNMAVQYKTGHLRQAHKQHVGAKKAQVPFLDPGVVTVTATETVYVTTTVVPIEPVYITTTQVLLKMVYVTTEAATATTTVQTQVTATNTETTVITATETETETQTLSTQVTTSLTETSTQITTATTNVIVSDTATVTLTVSTPHTVINTVTATQTPTPIIIVENAKKRHVQDRAQRVKRSWYTEYIPKFIKSWMAFKD